MNSLWGELSVPWRACVEEAWAAFRSGSLPIGAAVVDDRGRIIARGRNLQYERTSGHALSGSMVGHAEIIALSKLRPWKRHKACAIYTTTEPCAMCAGAILMSRIPEIHYASRDPHSGAAPMLVRNKRRVLAPAVAALEELLIALFVVRLHKIAPSQIEIWRKAHSTAVEFGMRLARNKTLRSLAIDGASAQEMLEALERSLRP